MGSARPGQPPKRRFVAKSAFGVPIGNRDAACGRGCPRPAGVFWYAAMAQEILIAVGAAEVRVAVLENGVLQGYSCEVTLDREAGNREVGPRRGGSRVGEIHLARVSKVVPAIQAAFVEIGLERAGFLGAKEAKVLAPDPDAAEADIGRLVREGDMLAVQIVKDPIGEKGARLTAAVTLAGRLVVLTPRQSVVSLSRRIEDEAERVRLTELGRRLIADGGDDLVAGAGYILRTNAVGAQYEEIRDEAVRLAQRWRAVLLAQRSATPPTRLYRDLGPIERVLRETATARTARIAIDDANAFAAAVAACREAYPALEARLNRAAPGSLFDDRLEADIAGLSEPRVPLACGGWITVEKTEALTAVDVNSGSFVGGAGLEDTGLKVNLEAAAEVGRQIRLRGIGGVIVVDFIHMQDPEHAARVLAALKAALAGDSRPVEVAPLSPFGLVEVTRKRMGEPLETRTGEPCACCRGLGHIRRPGAVALEALRGIERAARAAPGAAIHLSAAPEVVDWLAAQGQTLSEALAGKGAVRVVYHADPTRRREAFDVETRSA